MNEVSVEIIHRVWVGEGYLLLRSWPDAPEYIEMCTEPGLESEDYFGKISISFRTPAELRDFARSLELAALDIEKEGKE